MAKTLETTVDKIGEAVLQAGFQPGRRLRVEVRYVDEEMEASHRRLNALLDKTPLPPPFDTMSEAEIIAMANEEIRACRAERQRS